MADEQDIKNILDGLKAISGDSREATTKRRVQAERLILQKKTNKELDRYISDLREAAKGDIKAQKAVKDLTESVEDTREAHEKARKETER